MTQASSLWVLYFRGTILRIFILEARTNSSSCCLPLPAICSSLPVYVSATSQTMETPTLQESLWNMLLLFLPLFCPLFPLLDPNR